MFGNIYTEEVFRWFEHSEFFESIILNNFSFFQTGNENCEKKSKEMDDLNDEREVETVNKRNWIESSAIKWEILFLKINIKGKFNYKLKEIWRKGQKI